MTTLALAVRTCRRPCDNRAFAPIVSAVYALTRSRTIELSGPDAAAYAQAQFCNDVDALPVGGAQLSAWLNPDGRIRALFHLLRPADDRFVLVLRGGDAQALERPLRMFVLRLKTKVDIVEHVVAALEPGEAPPAGAFAFAVDDTRLAALLPPDAVASDATPRQLDAWTRADIDAGLPWLPPHALDAVLPSWLDLARLGGISHRKGCYPGQEIVARLHFRGGGDKRRLTIVAGDEATMAAATTLRDTGGAEAGVALQSANDGAGRRVALAVVRKEVATIGSVLSAANGSIQVISAKWNRPD